MYIFVAQGEANEVLFDGSKKIFDFIHILIKFFIYFSFSTKLYCNVILKIITSNARLIIGRFLIFFKWASKWSTWILQYKKSKFNLFVSTCLLILHIFKHNSATTKQNTLLKIRKIWRKGFFAHFRLILSSEVLYFLRQY